MRRSTTTSSCRAESASRTPGGRPSQGECCGQRHHSRHRVQALRQEVGHRQDRRVRWQAHGPGRTAWPAVLAERRDKWSSCSGRGALQPRIELRQIAEEHPTAPDWAEGLPEFTGFGDCPNDNCYTGDVSWRSWPQSTGSVVEAGSCEHCGTWAVRCPECGSETGFFSDDVDCEGCERRFALVMGHKAVDYEDVVMLDGRA